MVKLFYKIYTLLRYYPSGKIRKVFRHTESLPHTTGTIAYKKILFCPFAPHQLNIIRESIWAHACRLRGADVKMLSYDLFLPAIDFLTPGVKKDLKVSYRIVKYLYKIIGLPAIYLSKYFNQVREDSIDCKSLDPSGIISLEHNNIKLGDLIIASTIRFFYSNGPEWDNPEFLDKAREFAETAIILTEIYEKVIEEEKPDKIVASHGIYVSWGTIFRVARQRNIPVDIYGGSYRKDTLRFNHNTPNAPFPEGEWDLFRNIDLGPDKLKQVDEYILTRATQSEDSISLFSEKDYFPDDLKRFLDTARNCNKKVFCLFTNISWDGYMYKQDDKTFSNMVEWVSDNIKYFKSRNDAFLIVKAHPAENYYNVPVKYRIRSIIDKGLPENIIFIDESANVKPVNLYEFIDVGLIYISTVSIEMALRKIPVVTAGVGGHYSNKDFTIDPVSKSEYFEIIDSYIKNNYRFTPDIDRAKNYLYFRFFGEALINDLLNIEKYKIKKINFKSLEDLMPGKNKVLDIICNGILNDTKFLN